ncbi:Short chain dehydrogenase sol3 [Lachnellula suecica]|uniref:Short chain dehydrogenase sol3 n=1 Tax=Lachnellula suecica TaxID=602035 RepID=A0A8T9CBQ4_9HELO|nr:Short chain dehydrogenase sol3 [Lachnellula suecica]
MPLYNVLLQPLYSLHLPPPGSFAGQTVLVTGANTGLGLATAQHLLNLGASKLILGVRSLTKGQAAKETIEAATTNLAPFSIEVWALDLGSYASIKAFAARAAKLERLDTAVLNAGLASKIFERSEEGWEMQTQVNVISTALLGLLLLPTMAQLRKNVSGMSRPPNMVVVGSDIHADAIFNERKSENILAALNDRGIWEKSMKAGPAERYGTSKLLNLYVALELARVTPLVDGEPAVVVNVMAPGLCQTELLSREEGAPWVLVLVQSLVGRPIEVGAKTVVDAAARGAEAHGKYYDHQKIGKLAPLVTSEEGKKLRAKVWEEILEVLEKTAPEVRKIASGSS